MDPTRKTTRANLRQLPRVKDYYQMVSRMKLTPRERKVCDMIYLKELNTGMIADKLGYSERTIKRIHRDVLEKASRSI